MNIKALIYFSLLFYWTAYPQFSQDQTTKSDVMNMGTISVTIGGSFPINGTFPALITERVDEFVTRMYAEAVNLTLQTITDTEIYRKLKGELANFALRGIKLKRATGEELTIDLQKFRLNGDFVNNPYLKNDDVLVFPTYDIDHNFFSVYGAVNKPGTFFYVEGDKLSDAIALAQGINPSYDNVSRVIIFRLSKDGVNLDSINVDLNNDIELNRGERVFVLGEESKRQDYKVNIIGEVINPGYYPITKNKTKLRDAIKMAGGFTEHADLSRSELIRGANAFESVLFNEQLEIIQMARMSTLIENDTLYFRIDEKLRFLRGNGLVDFAKVLDSTFIDGDFILRDFDVLFVPPKLNLVYVYGQVNRPGYQQYKEGEKLDFYLNLSGGKGQTAAEVYIIKGKSRSWISVEEFPDTEIEPGDYIWVSKITPRTAWFYIEQAARIAMIVGSIATVILLLLQF